MPTNLTRIKNNQVTDSTIVASAKLVPGSITGGLLSDPISYSGSMTISGNLTVQGTTTTVDTINTLVADPIIVLSKGETGTPSNDSGFLIERGTSDNAAFIWDETNDRFIAITTTSDGLSSGSIPIGAYANLKISDVEAATASIGNIDIGTNDITSTNTNGNINITPNGTGDVKLVADTVHVGDLNANATVTSNGTGNLILNTNNGVDTGRIVIYQGLNAGVDITADGAGEINLNTLAVTDLTANRVPYASTGGAIIDSANLTFDGNVLGITGNITISNTANLGNIRVSGNDVISTNVNGNINITPNGTGDINLSADTVVIGDLNTAAKITTSGVGNLTLDTNSGLNSSSIKIAEGVSGNITLTASGIGEVVANTLAVSDLTSGRVLLAGSSGSVTDSANLTFNGTSLTIAGNINVTAGTSLGNIFISNNSIVSTVTNSDINIEPNGIGDIYLISDRTIVGDSDTQALVTTNGTGNLLLSTNNGINSGSILITQGTNANINITANGTGEVVTNSLVVSDLTSGRVLLAGASGAVSDSSLLTFTSDVLSVTGNVTVSNTANLGNIRVSANDIISTNTNGDINITPDGTGDVNLRSNVIVIGDLDAETTVTTYGTGNLFLSTNGNSNSGNIKIAQGLNSNITITANGTGEVVTNTLAVSDLTSGRIVLAGTNGTLVDSTAFTYSGSDLSVTGDLAVNGGDITTTAVTANLWNANATTVNFAGAATTLEIGAASGTTNVNNNLDVDGNINLDGGNFTTTALTVNIANANSTTVNFAGAATTLEIGAATGTTNVNNNLDVDGNINLDGGNFTTTAATVNIANANSTTVNFAGAATVLEIGAATGTTNINNNLDVDGDINMDGGDFTVSTATVNIANANATTVNFAGAATTLEIGAATGTTNINNNLDVDGNINLDGSNFTVTTSTVNIANANATTVNFAGAATTLEIGAATGTTNINNDLDVDGNINLDGSNFTTTAVTVNIANANTTTLNVGGAATTLNMGASSGTTTVNNDLKIMGNDIKSSTGNVAISMSDIDVTIIGNLTVQGVTTNIGTQDLIVEDSIIRLHTTANLAPLTSDDGRDVGIVFHYYKTSNKEAGLVWANDTGALEYYSDATESVGGTFAGVYGNIKAASFFSNVADGTAPFTVNSTTRVANLNVAASGIANTVVDAAQPNITSLGNLAIVNIDNIQINDNTISTTNTNGNLVLAPNGTGDVQLDADTVRIGDSGDPAILTTNGAANLLLSTNEGTNSGNIVIVNGTNGNINITPNGTGDINLVADSVVVGDSNATGTLTTNGTGNLVLNTNGGASSSNIVIAQGTNGNITLTADGTGEVVANTLAVSDLTSGRVTVAGSNGALTDNANLTFNGTVLTVTGNANITSTANIGNMQIGGTSITGLQIDTAITITPNGTGDINLSADNVVVGDSNATGTITTNGTGNLFLSTNSGTNSGNIEIAQGTNGNITITANGTGEVVTNTLAVSDLTSGRVTLAGANGALSDNANLTFSGTLLTVTGSANITSTANIGNIQIDNSNITGLQTDTNITITPNGTGDIVLAADNVIVGDSNATGTVTTNGAGNLVLNTNSGTNSGNIQIAQGADGNITITANGTGEVITNTLAVSDLTSGRVTLAGTSGALVDNSNLTFSGTLLTVTGNANVTSTANIGNMQISGTSITGLQTDTAITITPNGTGNINLSADSIIVGDSNTEAIVTTNGTGNLRLSTNADTNSGNIVIAQGINGNINLTANGTGEINLSTLAVADLTSGRVPYASTNGSIVDNSNLTFSGTLLTVTGNANITTTANIGNMQISGTSITGLQTDTSITITPNGTGSINLSADTVVVGDVNTSTLITTNGTGNLNLSTNAGVNSGNIQIAQGINGNITITANGTGEIVTNTLAVSDLQDTRVVFAGPNGTLVDSSDLTFTSTELTVRSNLVVEQTSILGNIEISSNTISSINTNGNVNIEANGTGDVVINSSGDNSDFYVYGNTATYASAVIYTKASSGQVGIRTESPAAGAALHINSVDAMIIPTGGTGDRPLTPATGMLRFNTTTNFVEFFNGLTWESTSGSFTVINYENFVGDGSTKIFTMAGGSTTAGTIVAVNGSLQQPGTAYSISGTTLTFVSAPTVGQQIDVRRLTTTTTVTELAEGDTIMRVSDSGSNGTVSLIADGVTIVAVTNALVTVSGNIQPNANNTIDLGSSSLRWNDVYSHNLDLSGNLAVTGSVTTTLIPNANNSIDLGSGALRWNDVYSHNLDLSGDITVLGSVTTALIPSANNSVDLGSSGFRWQDVYAHNLDLSGSVVSTLIPSANNSVDLGSSSFRWQDVYAHNLDLSGSVASALIPSANNTIDLGSASLRWNDIYSHNLDLSGNLTVLGSVTAALIPNANNTIDIGSSSNRWQDVYAVSVDINGTPAATTDDATALAIALG